jgi:ankyrin repeat protein
VVKLLLEKRANVKAVYLDRWMALYMATSNGHEPMIKQLFEKRVNVEVKNSDGWRVLYWTAWRGHEVGVKLLEAKDSD